jgi:hypothetical protein
VRLKAVIRDLWFRVSVFGALLIVYVLSARYCFTIYITDKHAIGLAAGAAVLQERAQPRPGVGPFAKPIPPDRRVFYVYRHEFAMQWWYSIRAGTASTTLTLEVAFWPAVVLAGSRLRGGISAGSHRAIARDAATTSVAARAISAPSAAHQAHPTLGFPRLEEFDHAAHQAH